METRNGKSKDGKATPSPRLFLQLRILKGLTRDFGQLRIAKDLGSSTITFTSA